MILNHQLGVILQEVGWKDQKEDFRLHLFKKLVLEKGRVATYEFIPTIQVLLNTSKVFRKSGIKKEVKKLTSCPVWQT
jgi:hypothetical protein